MDCRGAFVLNRKLKPVKDNGVILVLEEDCSKIFGDSTTKKEEDMLMTRVEGNLFQYEKWEKKIRKKASQ
jgi:hypothetical protein